MSRIYQMYLDDQIWTILLKSEFHSRIINYCTYCIFSHLTNVFIAISFPTEFSTKCKDFFNKTALRRVNSTKVAHSLARAISLRIFRSLWHERDF